MYELFAILGLAAACAVWVLVDRASGCPNRGRCGACSGGRCSRDAEEGDAQS
ncbi:MAG: hypothetical protein HS104_39400 [Polyangiaceae bacterium]|nr:hypothetical protein [Polyangiaceae bacterium]MBK8999696.1 hypothetical protein [Myxococcales bacterium]MCL4756279.1 hypothetical protein [Myxococcales bacterium]